MRPSRRDWGRWLLVEDDSARGIGLAQEAVAHGPAIAAHAGRQHFDRAQRPVVLEEQAPRSLLRPPARRRLVTAPAA